MIDLFEVECWFKHLRESIEVIVEGLELFQQRRLPIAATRYYLDADGCNNPKRVCWGLSRNNLRPAAEDVGRLSEGRAPRQPGYPSPNQSRLSTWFLRV